MKDLANKVIIVTGANGLIGKEIVAELIEHDAIIISADISFDTEQVNNRFLKYHLDLSDTKSIENLVGHTIDTYGRIDGLINAAYPRTKDWGKYRFEDTPFSHWKENVDLQLNSVFYLDQQVSKIMEKQGSGSIVNFGSIYGIVGNDFTIYEDYGGTSPAEYCAIKGGIINFTRYMASYLGKYKIRVNCVCPGGIWDHQREEFVKNYEHRCPMKRMGHPDDIAPLCLFLVSDGAKYITGQIIAADGGWTAI
ncbi:MAG: SDR family oxidoreductase [Muribaculaceae bacterium]|nr:SDR family oxidoreductase [Muribaculaceae bacterium]